MMNNTRLAAKLLLLLGLSFSAFPQVVHAQSSISTKATVTLIDSAEPDKPNDILDPYDPDDPYPGDENDPGNIGTGQIGQLVIDYSSNLRFGNYQIQKDAIKARALNTHPMVQVTDNRGNGSGWTLQVRPDYLVGEQTGATIKDGSLVLGTLAIRKPSSNVSSPPISKTQTIQLGAFANVVTAEKNTGMSTWTIGLNQDTRQATQLILNNTNVATPDHYVGTMTWSLTDAPV